MCGECSQCMDHPGFAVAQGSVCFPGLPCLGSRVLCKGTVPSGPYIPCDPQVWAAQVLESFAGQRPRWAVRFVPPRSKQLRQPSAWWAHCPRCATHLNYLPGPGLWFPRCATRAPSQVCRVSLGSWSQAVTLLADVNHPGSQEDVASNWEHAHSLVKDAGSGAEIAAAPCLPALALSHACLSASGEGGPYIAAGSHSFGIHSSLFCECTRGDRAVLEPFSGKFFFFPLAIPCCGIMSAHSDCHQGIQAQSLP